MKCPYQDCSFQSTVYSTFTGHLSRYHSSAGIKNLRLELVRNHLCENGEEAQDNTDLLSFNEPVADVLENVEITDEVCLQRKLASLFLRMQTLLHVSKTATQEIIDEFYEVSVLTGELSKKSIEQVLSQHNISLEPSTFTLIADTLDKSVPLSFLSKSGELGTEHKRASFFRQNFKIIEPVEYFLDSAKGRKEVHVPLLPVLTELLNRDDVLDKALDEDVGSNCGFYKSFRDGKYFQENIFFSAGVFRIALGLYIDDFEVCNPLGTSKKKHKICAVYWVLANLPLLYRSSLTSINLALLCHTSDVKTYGYSAVLEPLLRDIEQLETKGVYIERLGGCVQGTVAFVSADNLAAHSLAGFQECFIVDKCCRFCSGSRKDFQTSQVKDGSFTLRTRASVDENVLALSRDKKLKSVVGVKANCVLNNLKHFHSATGFPPDVLHDLLEGVVPVELSLCLTDLIGRGCFSLDDLNYAIQNFPYRFKDKTNRPQKIQERFKTTGSIGGNGHENLSLLRLLPLMVGHLVPENDKTWGIILDLKLIVELISLSVFTTPTICFLESKISDHRNLLLEVFPNFTLKPKHHYLEHYPNLIHCFGPLLNFCTIRFEGKHSFFLKVVRDVNNFKNILLTLAKRHQLMFGYYLELPSLFKPNLEVHSSSTLCTDILDNSIKQALKRKYTNVMSVCLTTTITRHGTTYSEGMFVSFGSTSGLPDFGKIVKLLIVADKAMFIIEPFQSVYIEHLGSFELFRALSAGFLLVEPEDLNHYEPLYCYTIQGRQLVTAKAFLLH